MSPIRRWKAVAQHAWKAWQRIFANPSGLDLPEQCPVCEAFSLHRWFDKPRPFDEGRERPGMLGYGGEWRWCSSCHSYEHYSGMVPDWWQCDLEVDHALLTAEPEAIEDALLKRG